ncbi:MAG: substrate-binding domain-containing protein [Spirochaetales bacterium]|nr:substrate-binding domain-containing protein [Spirochaetales bacterium]
MAKQEGIAKKRPAIGFLIDVFNNQYQMEVWSGVSDTCAKEDLNLVCFCGGAFKSPYEHDARTKVYELIHKKDIDGLIILSSTIGNFISKQELKQFCSTFSGIPTLNIGSIIQGLPSVVVDSDQSMFELVAHCIQEHDCRRIAFIKGTDDNDDALKRFAMYKKALAHFEIPLKPDLIIPGDFVYGSGQRAVSILLDERKADVDAIIGANDLTAIGAIEALQARGIKVPEQIKVVGFDNIEEGRLIKPKLTTISQPVYSLGYKAVMLMKHWLAGEEIAEITVVPTYLKIRQSCGCLTKKPQKHIFEKCKELKEKAGNGFCLKDDIFDKIKGKLSSINVQDCTKNIIFDYANTLYTIFHIAIKYKRPQVFIDNLEHLICESRQYDVQIDKWKKAIQEIFSILFASFTSTEYEDTLACLYVHFTELIRDIERREHLDFSIYKQRIAVELHRFSQKLIITFNLEKLKPKIVDVIEKLAIKRIIIFQSTRNIGAEREVTPILAYDDRVKISESFPEIALSKDRLIAECLRIDKKRITYIVMPLFIETELLGFVVFEPSLLKGIIYENFTVQLSSALKSAFIVEELQKNTDELQKSLHEKEVLLREVHHRVKNNLQIVLSLMNFKVHNNKETIHPENYYGIKSRIQAIALIHEELLDRNDVSVIDFNNYVNSLVDRIIYTSANGLEITKNIDIKDIFLDIQTATPCGLVINEIINNSLKYAFKKKKDNVITIKMKYCKDKKTIEMLVGDNGRGLPPAVDFQSTETVGLELIKLLVRNQLEGKIELMKKPGTCYKINFISEKVTAYGGG